MESFQSSDLKAILHSKRSNIYYLEHCRVMQKDGRVLYLKELKNNSCYYNIPIANTTVVMLGVGTSLTQAAARMLSQAGVIVGFCGSNGTPLYCGCEVEWLSPQSEYRPTEYMQGWLSFWFNDSKRLDAAKKMQLARVEYIINVFQKDKILQEEGFLLSDQDLTKILTDFKDKINKSNSINGILLDEANFIKSLYKYSAIKTGCENFSRKHDLKDKVNDFLNHGNYLCYGLAASCLWVLGIPHGFAVMHGKTRRGALVFDVADLIKSAIVLPIAFISAKRNDSEQEFRKKCIQMFTIHGSLDFMFDQVKYISSYHLIDINNKQGSVDILDNNQKNSLIKFFNENEEFNKNKKSESE